MRFSEKIMLEYKENADKRLAAYCLKVVPDEPLVTLKGTILYGILPRSIEFIGMVVVCYFISQRIEKLITTLANKNKELYADQG